jgi:hypothetical protein
LQVTGTFRQHPVRSSARAESPRLDFLVDVDPTYGAPQVAIEFLELVDKHKEALRLRYAWPAELPPELYESVAADGLACGRPFHPGFDDKVEWIHVEKVPIALCEALEDARLCALSKDGAWVAMHPRLGAVYLAALADRVARANDMPTVTDQTFAYGTLNGWSMDTLAQALLEQDTPIAPSRSGDEVGALYAALAIQTVVPEGLEHIPIAKIVQARRKLAAEFDAFSIHLDSLAEHFAALSAIEDPAILQARLKILVERDLRRPAAELDKGLRQLGLEPGRAVFVAQSGKLPLVASALVSTGLPMMAAEGGVMAAQILSSSVRARRTAQERRQSSPAGYLLGLQKELTSVGAVERLRKTFRRASAHTAGELG